MITKDLSVIIVSWRVKELLRECLKSIFENTEEIDFEVIVIDNDSGDGTVEMVEQEFPKVTLIASKTNLGFAGGNNLGIKQACGRHLLLLNPDTQIIDNSLKKVVDYLDAGFKTAVLGGQLLNPDQTIQPSVRRFPRVIDHLIMMFKLHHLIPLNYYLATDFNYSKNAEVDQVMGAFFAISGAGFKELGLLDEEYYIWFEEVDYCRRAKGAGWQVIYNAEIKAVHYGGMSFKQVSGFKNQLIFNRSRLRYIKKYQGWFAYFLILLLSPVSLLLSTFNFKHER